jgi:hypothetical protein
MKAAEPCQIRQISGISVIFDFGLDQRGESVGLYSQADVVDLYGYRLNEELEYENVRTYYIDTRRKPARTFEERLQEVPANFVPVILSADWHERERLHNASIVEFCGNDLYPIATRICEALTEWGNCYVWGHKVSRAVAVAGDRPFIRVSPFAVNGPHVDEYMSRLDKLGEDIGRAIGGYLRGRGEGVRR